MNSESGKARGIIAQYEEKGYPVVIKFVNKMPSTTLMNNFPNLTIISWKYDGHERNGMPPTGINNNMITLENAIHQNLVEHGYCVHAYSRTGNGLKELVYYCADTQQFIVELNNALNSQPLFPIDIDFHPDANWSEFRTLLSDMESAQ